jgi:hypothetical protein
MVLRERSLRHVVELWLGAVQPGRLRVTRFGRSRGKRWRHVHVEVSRDKGVLGMLFFLHDDGSWCVFPPSPCRPVMGGALLREHQA